MVKISDKLAELGDGNGFVSLEFFPPKTDSGLKNLLARIQRMSIINPLFINITWGAGGSTAEKSLELAAYCQREFNLTTCLHLTCTNTNRAIIDDALARAKQAGIQNILALRGDPPRAEVLDDIEDVAALNNGFTYAVDLVKYIREQHGDYFAIGVAAYPDGHVDGADNTDQDFQNDLPFLVEKVKAGADFIITQLFFDVDQYLTFEAKVLEIPELQSIPIIPGLIPINNYQLFQRVSRLSHASIPKSILSRFPLQIQNDDKKVKEIGIEILSDVIDKLYTQSKSRIKGFHFYTLNLEGSIAKLVTTSKVLQKFTHFDSENSSKAGTPEPVNAKTVSYNNKIISEDDQQQSNNTSYLTDNKQEIGKLHDANKLSKKEILAISTGAGTLGKEATWDEFPNGRFGDSRSPAYGEIDGYGPSLKVPFSVKDPIKELWGTPHNLADIRELFIDFLSKKIPALPFSDLEISAETLLIQEELFEINSKYWFSLSSQPAINGCPSSDSVFGWGARNGYLYQKAYIELLILKKDWESVLKPKIDFYNRQNDYGSDENSKNNEISYYVAGSTNTNTKQDKQSSYFDTNICPNNRATAVTWGVFPNKEIVQTTIIEEQSFKAWKDEAFKILLEWANLYLIKWKNFKAKEGEEEEEEEKLKAKYENAYKLIRSIVDDFYLVTIFANDFQEEDALWNLLTQ